MNCFRTRHIDLDKEFNYPDDPEDMSHLSYKRYFEKNNIQTRTIFTGNILKQPVMKNRKYKKHPQCDAVADNVMRNGILLGCHQGMKKNELDYICQTFIKFFKHCK